VLFDTFIIDLVTAAAFCFSTTQKYQDFSKACASMMSLLNHWEHQCDNLNLVFEKITQAVKLDRQKWLSNGSVVTASEVQLLAPVPFPGKVICVAENFPKPGKTHKPDYPTIFLKPSSTVTSLNQPVFLTDLTQAVSIEVELALVINKASRHISVDEAFSSIAGYILANDIGDMLLEQRTSQWTSGKMFDSFTPMGPWLVTKDEIDFKHGLEMTSTINGEIVQSGITAEMFFSPAELIHLISDLTTLYPGDVILTGSPKTMEGKLNPTVFLKDGDIVNITINGLGELSNPVIKEK